MVRLPDKNTDDGETQGLPTLAALSQEVRELVRLISSTDISELHLESGPVRIIIKRGVSSHASPSPAPQNAVYTPPATLAIPENSSVVNLIGHNPAHGEGVALVEGEQLIVAPMVGTFYSAPAPTEPPYIGEGDEVEPGQIVGIIEAMKMMNQIESEVTGRVIRILVQNAQPVEYGQPLMVVSTDA
ncbi:MAG: acetyl-CoA carboxylase biotin carboxyl carrier protein [Chloroflexota bacterium]